MKSNQSRSVPPEESVSRFKLLKEVFLFFQPDLLNFKKGWMVKLDENGEVIHMEIRRSKADCA